MDFEIKSTKASIEDFKESILWQDMLVEMDLWIESLQSNDEITGSIIDGNLNSGAALAKLGYVKGCREAVGRFKQILDILLNNKEEKQNDFRCVETE